MVPIRTDSNVLHPSNWVPVVEQPVFQPRKLRVACVGAGQHPLHFVIQPYLFELANIWQDIPAL
jgi:hypothetical protein